MNKLFNEKELFELNEIVKQYQENLKKLIDTENNPEDKKSLEQENKLIEDILKKIN